MITITNSFAHSQKISPKRNTFWNRKKEKGPCPNSHATMHTTTVSWLFNRDSAYCQEKDQTNQLFSQAQEKKIMRHFFGEKKLRKYNEEFEDAHIIFCSALQYSWAKLECLVFGGVKWRYVCKIEHCTCFIFPEKNNIFQDRRKIKDIFFSVIPACSGGGGSLGQLQCHYFTKCHCQEKKLLHKNTLALLILTFFWYLGFSLPLRFSGFSPRKCASFPQFWARKMCEMPEKYTYMLENTWYIVCWLTFDLTKPLNNSGW